MHTLLSAAHNAVDPSHRPPGPHHGGLDINPQLYTFGHAGVAIFLAERVAKYVSNSDDRARFEDFLGIARDIYGKHARGEATKIKGMNNRVTTDHQLETLRRKLLGSLRDEASSVLPLPSRAPLLSDPVVIARDAAFAALDVEAASGGSFSGSLMRDAVKRTLTLLPKKEIREFLNDLDRCLLREELRANLSKRRDPLCARVEACVWRASAERPRVGRGRTGTQIAHWIGRLRNDEAATVTATNNNNNDYIIVWWLGTRWDVSTGSRDEVLATVPDDHMESAVKAVFAASVETTRPARRRDRDTELSTPR